MDPDSNPPPSPLRGYVETRSPSRLRGVGERGLNVLVTDGRGRALRDGGLVRWLSAVAPAAARGRELGVAIVSDARIRVLNRIYRGKDYATDVLSFPDASRTPHPASRTLGEIVIAKGVAARQAREQQHSYQTELRILALHGLLHLLGYDHDDPRDKGRMARAEARLRKKGGLTTGLIARAASVSRRPSTSLGTALSVSKGRSPSRAKAN